MKLSILTSTLLLFVASLSAQNYNNLSVFAEDGELFTLYVNGAKQNDTPSATARAERISNGNASIKLVFSEVEAPDVKKNVTFLDPNTEVTLKLTMTKKGYKLRMFGEAPIGDAPPAPIAAYSQKASESTYEVETSSSSPLSTETTITTTEVTTTTTDDSSDESVRVNMGINGINMNMSIDIDDNTMDVENSGSSTTTTTTTTTTTYGGQSEVLNSSDVSIEAPEVDRPCSPRDTDVDQVLDALSEESFADDKMMVLKRSMKSRCIHTDDVKRVAEEFSFEDDKVEALKYLYDRTYNQDDFYQVYSILNFSDSKDQLDAYIEGR